MYRPRDPTRYGGGITARYLPPFSKWVGVFRGPIADTVETVLTSEWQHRTSFGGRVTPHKNGLALYNVPGRSCPPRHYMTPEYPTPFRSHGRGLN